jgi:glycerol uptake operon antiterminator
MAVKQRILPAIRQMKDFEKVLKYNRLEYIVLLDTHIVRLKEMIEIARKNNKRVILHADLVHGLKQDEYAAEFICQKIKPDGIISTRSNILFFAKKNKIKTVQRLFLLDSMSIETGLRQFEKVQPDYIELLPGIVPKVIIELKKKIDIPIIAGGLIQSMAEVSQMIEAGASMVSTSQPSLWEQA